MEWREIETIRIDGMDYDLEFVDPGTQVKADKLGAAYLDELKIKILEGNQRREIQTLWHEIIHVIDDNRLGYNLSETQTNTLGCSIYQVLADIPICSWLCINQFVGWNLNRKQTKKRMNNGF